jgi:hypothetical protein
VQFRDYQSQSWLRFVFVVIIGSNGTLRIVEAQADPSGLEFLILEADVTGISHPFTSRAVAITGG